MHDGYAGDVVAEHDFQNADFLPGELADFKPFPAKRAISALQRYALTLLFVATALSATLLLQHIFPYPFLFFAAVMISAWFGGRAAGLFAVLISTLTVDYFFVPPFYSFAINATEGTYFAAFVVCALVASWVSSSKKKSEEALKEARDQLEVRVAMRTAELQKSNVELRQSERQLRLLTEVIPQQIWCGTPDGFVDYCNQRLLQYVGHGMEEMRGNRLMEAIHPEDRQGFSDSWRNALSIGNPFEGEWRVRGAHGQYRWFFIRAVPLRDSEGRTLRWYGTNTDIEEHKNAQQALTQTQAELTHLSRVLTMGELAASIAHEVNQPLAAVVTYADACMEWLSARPPKLEEARNTVERIIQDGARAGAVLGRIRALFKKETPARDWLDVNELIHEMTLFLREEIQRNRISMKTELSTDVPKVKGDRVQLQQVVLNLIMNGIDAMRTTKRVPRELIIRTRRAADDEILICIEDSGIGLSIETAEKIFNPFFTTKPQGIGMGLSISRSIVESHHGRLWAAPRPSGGAIFQFTIPGAEPEGRSRTFRSYAN